MQMLTLAVKASHTFRTLLPDFFSGFCAWPTKKRVKDHRTENFTGICKVQNFQPLCNANDVPKIELDTQPHKSLEFGIW